MDHSVRSGTLTGTICSLLGIVGWIEIERTIVLGGVGAAVSFLVSWLLKKLIRASGNLHRGAEQEKKNNLQC